MCSSVACYLLFARCLAKPFEIYLFKWASNSLESNHKRQHQPNTYKWVELIFYFNPFHFRDSTFQNAIHRRLNGPIWIIMYTYAYIWTKSGNFHGILETQFMKNATKFVLFFPLPVKVWSCRMLRLRIVNLSLDLSTLPSAIRIQQ